MASLLSKSPSTLHSGQLSRWTLFTWMCAGIRENSLEAVHSSIELQVTLILSCAAIAMAIPPGRILHHVFGFDAYYLR